METAHYHTLLSKRLAEIEREMHSLGQADASSGWEVKDPQLDIAPSDENELADKAEEMQTDAGVLEELSVERTLLTHALKKVAQGTFGVCEVCGAEIEKERLDALPSARTCLAHVDEEDTLPLGE